MRFFFQWIVCSVIESDLPLSGYRYDNWAMGIFGGPEKKASRPFGSRGSNFWKRCTALFSVTSQKVEIFIATGVKTLNPTTIIMT
jgi:hypothetical protein